MENVEKITAKTIYTDESCQMRDEVKTIVEEYNRICEEFDVKVSLNHETINRKVEQFLGHRFTLAVVGGMNSGKSMFVNTLIDGDNLIPSGHCKTTNTIVYIEKGDGLKMDVEYCDNRKETITGKAEIKEGLKQLMGETGAGEVKQNAKEVHVYCELPDDYQGWKFVYMPDVEATEAQVVTKKLFAERDNEGNNIIDAIVFLHNGTDNIEEESTRNFIDSLDEDAKRRFFFVLTNAFVSDFVNLKDAIRMARDIYAKALGIPEERFTYVDCLLERFNKDVKDKKYFNEMSCPSNWGSGEWKQMTSLYAPIKKQILGDGKAVNNVSIEEVIREWSQFGLFKKLLNGFAKEEGSKIYKEILTDIKNDYLDIIRGFDDGLVKLKGDISFDKLWKEFDFVDDEINAFDKEKDIDSIKVAYTNLCKKLKNTEHGICNSVKEKYGVDFCDDTYSEIDSKELNIKLENLLKEAEQRTIKNDFSLKTYCSKKTYCRENKLKKLQEDIDQKMKFEDILRDINREYNRIRRYRGTLPDSELDGYLKSLEKIRESSEEFVCRNFLVVVKEDLLEQKKRLMKVLETFADRLRKLVESEVNEKRKKIKQQIDKLDKSLTNI